jgi:hypothetical protein
MSTVIDSKSNSCFQFQSFWLQHHQYLQASYVAIFDGPAISDSKFRNVLLISAAISVGVKLIAAKLYEDEFLFLQQALA